MIKKSKRAVALSGVLSKVLERRNWQGRLALHRIFLFWDQAVGPEIAAQAQPSLIRGNELWVDVIDSMHIQLLQFRTPEILGHLNRRLAQDQERQAGEPIKLESIRLQMARGPLKKAKPPDQQPEERPKRPIDPARQQKIDQLLESVEDRDIRETLRRMWTFTEQRLD